ncbi:muconolactone D-isomerase [Bradyrhizobium sp. cir1]|uniref:muconolactone Delta-isomerase n=1 Tax=Bradyrhizobium sp. cir1 TaxID=1445730 RepID=UPI00160574DF|nr:muconolactone Delta-isomerase [Bradyrhizobium sp. cir1]MBB4368364.1 muconolactone D-isomerase [Bradyrhizobium sp. cir1]
MLFQVEMTVEIPHGLAPDVVAQLKETERQRAQELQRSGQWRHLWRVAGRYANISIFDVESNEALHDILSTLPLFPFMRVSVTPLCRHPSSNRADDG